MDETLLLDTVKRMLDSGISEDVVKSTLKDLGISETESRTAISKAKGLPAPVSKPSSKPLHEQIAEKAVQKIQQHLDERDDLQELADSSTELALKAHEDKLEEVHSSLQELHEKVGGLPGSEEHSQALADLEDRVKQVQKEIRELKAQGAAVQELLKKVLQALK